MRRYHPALIVLLTTLWFLGTGVQSFAGYAGDGTHTKASMHSDIEYMPATGSLPAESYAHPHHSAGGEPECCFMPQGMSDCSQMGGCQTSCLTMHSPVYDALTTTAYLTDTDSLCVSAITTVTTLLQFRFYPPETPPP